MPAQKQLTVLKSTVQKNMHHNPQAYHLISALLHAWEAEGYALGVDSQLLLRELLNKIPEDTTLEQLKTLITPVLADSKEQQILFYEIFDKKLAETQQFFKETVDSSQLTVEKTTPSVFQAFWQTWRYFILFSISILFFIWVHKTYFDEETPDILMHDVAYIPIGDSIKIIFVSTNLSIFNNTKLVNDINNFRTEYVEQSGNINPNVRVYATNSNDKNAFYIKGLRIGIDKITFHFSQQIPFNQVHYTLHNGKGSLNPDSNIIINIEKDTAFIFELLVNVNSIQDGGSETTFEKTDSLVYKPYNHARELSDLLPKDHMRFGWDYADWQWWKTFVLLIFIGLVIAIHKWWQQSNQLILKDLKGNSNAPYAWEIQIDGVDKVALNDAFYTASNQLRKRTDSEFQRFDVSKTVLATIKQGGRINFQYRYQTQGNEYLLD
jgi:hypothetical protein